MWVGSGWVRRVCYCYDPNPTRSTIKNIFITQSNPSIPKNRPNSVGWVRLGRFRRVGGLVTHPYTKSLFLNTLDATIY